MLRIFLAIIALIRNSFTRRRNQNNVRNGCLDIVRSNETARDVNTYNNAEIESFLSNSSGGNVVVTGNNTDIRNHVICKEAWKCHRDRMPAVILHNGNRALESLFASNIYGERACIINGSNRIYDPFVGLDRMEIAELVINSGTKDHKIEHMGNSYIYALHDLIRFQGRAICTESFVRCLRERSLERVIEMAEAGTMPHYIAENISSLSAQGILEQGKIESYFNTLISQGHSALAQERGIENAVSIREAIRQNKVVLIDVGATVNSLILDVMMYEIRKAMSEGYRFALMTDSISLAASEFYADMMTMSMTSGCSYVYSTQDVFIDTQRQQNGFENVTGQANVLIVLQHNSNISAERISQYLGTYRKQDINSTVNTGTSTMGGTQFFPGGSSNEGYGTSWTVMPRVEQAEIVSQGSNHAFIKMSGSSEIISVECTLGDISAECRAPTRRARTNRDIEHAYRRERGGRREQNRGMSWLVFFLLLLFFFPAAFVYSFIKCGTVGKIISGIFLLLFISYIIMAATLM